MPSTGITVKCTLTDLLIVSIINTRVFFGIYDYCLILTAKRIRTVNIGGQLYDFPGPGGYEPPVSPQDSQLQIGLVLNRLPLSYLLCAPYQHGCIASCPSCPLIPFLCSILSFLLLSVASPILIVPPSHSLPSPPLRFLLLVTLAPQSIWHP